MNKRREYLHQRFTKEQRNNFRLGLASMLPFFVSLNLTFWGRIAGSDKADKGLHFYTPQYMKHFKSLKNKRIKLLEIGVGGYSNPNLGGNSLIMWKKFFPFGKIFAVDLYKKDVLKTDRIKIFQGSQVDKDFLEEVTSETGLLDIIIDDGSHQQEHIIETFKLLFPKLKHGGVYVVEDLQTSYLEDFGGDSKKLDNPKTGMNFLKSLTDSVNYKHSGTEMQLFSIHFYSQLVFIHKV
jgi:hypothetical protein